MKLTQLIVFRGVVVFEQAVLIKCFEREIILILDVHN